jgi:hypothetical protein
MAYEKAMTPTIDVWWLIAERYGLADILKQEPDMVLYGEIYGHVQDLTYSVTKDEIVRFVAFDTYRDGHYLPFWDTMSWCISRGIPHVPQTGKGVVQCLV